MRSELQYNLQKARALATELRCTMDNIDELLPEGFVFPDFMEQWEAASAIEGMFDDLPERVIGEGHVKIEVEP